MRYAIALVSLCVPFFTFAAAVQVDDLLDTNCATSSANIKFTENSFSYDAWLYKTDDTAPADFYKSGSCGVANANRCALTYAPTTGETVKKLFYWSGTGPELEDGKYGIIEDSNSSPCGTINYAACLAAADPGQYQEFDIVSNYDDCLPAETSTASSTVMTDFESFVSYYIVFATIVVMAYLTYYFFKR